MKIIRSPGLPRGFFFKDGSDCPVVLRPLGLLTGIAANEAVAAGRARWLAGGPIAFMTAELFLDGADGVHVIAAPIGEIDSWSVAEGGAVAVAVAAALSGVSPPRPPFCGLFLDRPVIMGVVNVTPDSFHDGGLFVDPGAAIAQGEALLEAGADILDIGGESTRPGAEPISDDEELARIIPVIEPLARLQATISVDTRRASVMEVALARGARIVNDVTALADPGAVEIVAKAGASVVLMHMQGEPGTMQQAPQYDHAPYEVCSYLAGRIRACEDAGITRDRIAIDPGIGFGKTDAHNTQIMGSLAILQGLGCAVVVGASRKSLIGRLAGIADTADRLPGTIALTTLAAGQGAQIHRVHDVAEVRQALAIVDAVTRA
jgi:dihydropteroate synthase